jgi:outer membrane immunogenic protein
MRRTLVGFIAALALGSVSSAAFAADMAVPEPAPVMSWTGFYLGAGGGAAWADLDINHRRCLLDHHDDNVCSEADEDNFRRDFDETSDASIIGIVQGGFDWEVAPQFVVGVGADWTFGDVLGDLERNNNDENFGFHSHFENDGSSMVDVYGRAGFAPIAGTFLVYGLVGWSWLDVDTNFRIRDDNDETIFHDDDSFNANGLTFGGGVEWRFTENLSIRGEYRFTDLDNFDNNGRFDHCDGDWCDSVKSRNDIDLDVQRVLFTLNWRFGGFGAATAAAY